MKVARASCPSHGLEGRATLEIACWSQSTGRLLHVSGSAVSQDNKVELTGGGNEEIGHRLIMRAKRALIVVAPATTINTTAESPCESINQPINGSPAPAKR